MMLYVFHVDTGTMMTFEINLALESVVSLKRIIEMRCQIPAHSQVLLVSGGEVLRPEARVCSYSAGTDTNPIYMFSKTIIESNDPPRSGFDFGSDVDYTDQVETCLSMSASYSTVVACSQLAQSFKDLAAKHTHACDNLVHDQHLQQQGWAAVVANMDDVTHDFTERAKDFECKFQDHLKNKEEYAEILDGFDSDLETLSNIPILPALRLNAASNPFTAFDELHADIESVEHELEEDSEKEYFEDEVQDTIIPTDAQATTGSNDGSSRTSSLRAGGSTASEGDEGIETSRDGPEGQPPRILVRGKSRQSNREALTLLHWIAAKENQESLKHIAEFCKTAFRSFDEDMMTGLRKDVQEALSCACQSGMKRIKGLEERLSGLEQLMLEARRIEQEQKDLAQAFHQNQQSAASLADASVLQVLCESHRRQLKCMLRNQQRLRDVRARCAKAKEELSINLYHRLKWIVYVENRMFETDSRLMFYHRSLSRLKRHLAVIGQLHRAPRLFCTAVHEIVRRRSFSQAFLTWASEMACHLLTIHNNEVMRRRDFQALFSGHFLGGLFPGTEDQPPAYATQAPRPFDTELPKLTQADADALAARLPYLVSDLPPWDMTAVTNFFQSRSLAYEKLGEKEKQAEDRILAVVRESGLDRGFESETDTEEFEKVGQSPIERRAAGAAEAVAVAVPVRADAATITEENIESQQSEVNSLRGLLASLNETFCIAIKNLKNDLVKLKSDANEGNSFLKQHCVEVLDAWDKCNAESALRERETLQRLTVDHELEMNDIKLISTSKDDELRSLKSECAAIEEKLATLRNDKNLEIENLNEKISALESTITENIDKMEKMEIAKQKELEELQENLNRNYKGQLESLRSRFRLVTLTSMDRSPSESSLEKIEKPDMIELATHKTILHQTVEDLKIEKEEAIKKALEEQEEEFKARLTQEIEKVKLKLLGERHQTITDAMKRIVEEKDRQLEQALERGTQLMRECKKYKETIQQLSDPETSDFQSCSMVQSRVEALTVENTRLVEQLKTLQHNADAVTEKEQQTDCVQVIDGSTEQDPALRHGYRSHTPIGFTPGTLRLSSCNTGDIVFILWDGCHSNYSILQESSSLFLLHGDCLAAFDLKIHLQDESERKLYSVGKVESKEYCVAVKSGNKYQVALGTRFYRVRVKPLKPCENMIKQPAYCCDFPVLPKDTGTESSHTKSVISMSASASIVSYSGAVKGQVLREPMMRSVCPVSALEASCAGIERQAEEGLILEEQPHSIEVNSGPGLAGGSLPLSPPPAPCSPAPWMAVSAPPSAFQPEESVPYEINEKGDSGTSAGDQLISEVAEEAAP